MKTVYVVNFSHPITPKNVEEIRMRIVGWGEFVLEVKEVQIFIDWDIDIFTQIEEAVDAVGLTPHEWRESPIVVGVPGHNLLSILVMTELNKRMGHWPTVMSFTRRTTVADTFHEVTALFNLDVL